MQRLLLLSLGLLLSAPGFSQYLEEFDGTNTFVGTDNLAVTQGDSEAIIEGNGDSDVQEGVMYTIQVDGNNSTVDISDDAIVSIRARTSSVGTAIGIELIDAAGNETTIGGNDDDLVGILTGNNQVFNFDFSDDLGDVDASQIAMIKLIPDPGIGFFEATIIVDALSLGDELEAGPNFAYLDDLEGDSAVTAFFTYSPGFSIETDPASGFATIRGAGPKDNFENFGYGFRNQVDFSGQTVDFEEAGDKMYIRMRSTVENTLVRIDLVDSRGFASAGGNVSTLVGTEFTVYEFDYTNKYFSDQFTPPCNQETAPCPVDADDIAALRILVNPGQGIYAGDLIVDWITVGDPKGGFTPPEVSYTDCFEDGLNNFVSEQNGFFPEETNGQLEVTIDGTNPQYGVFVYNINNRELQEAASIDINESPKLFVKMRLESEGDNLPDALIRIDVVNTGGFVSNQSSVTNAITPNEDFSTFTYDFSGAQDGGFTTDPDAPCNSERDGGPCDVALDSIIALYIGINPLSTDGYVGKLVIDEISFGAPIEEGDCDESGIDPGMRNYRSNIPEEGATFFSSQDDGLVVGVDDDVVTITGDGTSGDFGRVKYNFNDGSDTVLVDMSGDDLRFKARVRESEVQVRVDMIDLADFSTTNAGRTATLTSEFQEFVLNFDGAYQDGGYGGTACPVSNGADPCTVDAQRLAGLYMYVQPGTGLGQFEGVIEIEFIRTGELVGVNAPREVADVRVTPNPVNDELTVAYDLEVTGDVTVSVYDGIGRQVATQSQANVAAGSYRNDFNLGDAASGIYQVVLSVDGYVGKTVTVVKQ